METGDSPLRLIGLSFGLLSNEISHHLNKIQDSIWVQICSIHLEENTLK